MELEFSVRFSVVMSGVYLLVGMLTGVWKYQQMAHSLHARAHYYIDIAHRSSLLYASATLILAVMAYFSHFSEYINFFCVLINIIFFSFSILAYIVHGLLQDTTNQFKQPHRLGQFILPNKLMKITMYSLIVAELGGTGILLLGAAMTLLK